MAWQGSAARRQAAVAAARYVAPWIRTHPYYGGPVIQLWADSVFTINHDVCNIKPSLQLLFKPEPRPGRAVVWPRVGPSKAKALDEEKEEEDSCRFSVRA